MYSTILGPTAYSASGEITLALGGTTISKMTVSGALTFHGLIVPGGPVDGMVVTFAILTTGFNTSFAHDSGSATDLTHRFWNATLAAALIAGVGAITYRFDSLIGTAPLGRWFQISRT
jgi:hypothetical protein